MNSPFRSSFPLSGAPPAPFHEPDIVAIHKRAIVSAIRWAWDKLNRTEPHILSGGTEEEITERLQTLLNERSSGHRLAPGLQDFESVTRGESQRTADGRIGKKPDMVFRPPAYDSVVNTTRWGWFVECKIVDGAASVAAYRDNGVCRFASGEYAAWVASGAMLGYVRDGTEPVPTLDAPLNGKVGTKWHKPGADSRQSVSNHDRSGLANKCIDITLTHIWLPAK
jgi:hypothetical protein